MRIGRNQYLAAPKTLEGLEYGSVVTFGGYHVYLGPDHRWATAEQGERKVLLLGLAVDADAPERNQERMCMQLLQVSTDAMSAFRATCSWGGRWAILYLTPDETAFWTDPCGLKQAFYSDMPEGRGMYASQARYLAEVLSLEPEAEAEDYLRVARERDREYAMPLEGTLYPPVHRLLPNHWITGAGGKASRIPGALTLKREQDGVESSRISAILAGAMAAFPERDNVAVTITAGLDSRLVLAAAAPSDRTVAFTFRYEEMRPDHPDLIIGSNLSRMAGITHEIIPAAAPSAEFADQYLEHSELGHPYWIQMAGSFAVSSLCGRIVIRGSCNEIVTKPMGLFPDALVTPRLLCMLFNIPLTAYSGRILKRWLKEAREVIRETDFSLLDLFYWEHRCGSWLAQCLNEHDVAGEIVTPFNVREYILRCAKTDISGRIPPHYTFFREMIQGRRPQWDPIPINPGRYASVSGKLKLLIKYRRLR